MKHAFLFILGAAFATAAITWWDTSQVEALIQAPYGLVLCDGSTDTEVRVEGHIRPRIVIDCKEGYNNDAVKAGVRLFSKTDGRPGKVVNITEHGGWYGFDLNEAPTK